MYSFSESRMWRKAEVSVPTSSRDSTVGSGVSRSPFAIPSALAARAERGRVSRRESSTTTALSSASPPNASRP